VYRNSDTTHPAFAWHWMLSDGAPLLKFSLLTGPVPAGMSADDNFLRGRLMPFWQCTRQGGRASILRAWHDEDDTLYNPRMFYTRLAQGLFGGRVNPSAERLTHQEAHMEHINPTAGTSTV
jgi:hypothetical protein